MHNWTVSTTCSTDHVDIEMLLPHLTTLNRFATNTVIKYYTISHKHRFNAQRQDSFRGIHMDTSITFISLPTGALIYWSGTFFVFLCDFAVIGRLRFKFPVLLLNSADFFASVNICIWLLDVSIHLLIKLKLLVD